MLQNSVDEMCDKAVITCFTVFDFVPDICKIQEMCDRVVSEDPFMLTYSHNRFKRKNCYMELFVIGLLQVKCLKTFMILFLGNEDLLLLNADFNKITFFTNEMDLPSVDLDKVNFDDDNNFYEDDPESIIHVRLLAWHNKFKNTKLLKKIKAMN